VAGSKRPSFLKRQKEQKRLARAAEKREARRARKEAKAAAQDAPELLDQPLESGMEAEEVESEEVGSEAEDQAPSGPGPGEEP
jgi:hypothetical protein